MELCHRLELSIGGGPASEMTAGQPEFLLSALDQYQPLNVSLGERLLSARSGPMSESLDVVYYLTARSSSKKDLSGVRHN
jgi:hypothetical protein